MEKPVNLQGELFPQLVNTIKRVRFLDRGGVAAIIYFMRAEKIIGFVI